MQKCIFCGKARRTRLCFHFIPVEETNMKAVLFCESCNKKVHGDDPFVMGVIIKSIDHLAKPVKGFFDVTNR